MSISARITAAREAAHLSKSELARRLGRSPSAVTQWESGETRALKAESLIGIARETGVRAEWLETGKGPMRADAVDNVTEAPPLRSRVPLISWTTAGTWADVEDWHPVGNGEEWVHTTARVGPNAFALRVVGDSMEPRIPDGAIVILDPDRAHHHGTIVLAKRVLDQQATLKQLWFDGATPSLRPLNPRYPILDMPADTRIIGVAVRLELDL
jgi:SOS-response transcriptional repressor LexA